MGIKNKKGISAVVANVLIVLLVIASIGIIWAVVRPTIQSAGEQVSSDCFSLLINAESCVIDATAQTVTIDVSRDPGAGNLNGIRFIVSGVLDKVVSDSDATSGDLPDELETLSFIFSTALGGILEGIASGDTVDVASVIGEQQTLCNPSGTPVVCGVVANSPECSDGIDNDNDGWIDFNGAGSPGGYADPGCSNADDNDESTPAIGTECSDQIDNNDLDAGELVDGNDPECLCSPGVSGPDGPTWTSETTGPGCSPT